MRDKTHQSFTGSFSLACLSLTYLILTDDLETGLREKPFLSLDFSKHPLLAPNAHVWKHPLTLLGYSGGLHSRFPAQDLGTNWKTKNKSRPTLSLVCSEHHS